MSHCGHIKGARKLYKANLYTHPSAMLLSEHANFFRSAMSLMNSNRWNALSEVLIFECDKDKVVVVTTFELMDSLREELHAFFVCLGRCLNEGEDIMRD